MECALFRRTDSHPPVVHSKSVHPHAETCPCSRPYSCPVPDDFHRHSPGQPPRDAAGEGHPPRGPLWSTSTAKRPPHTPGDAAFGVSPQRVRKINGMGTGIIIDERGYIITNHHVVNGVDSLHVTLDNGGHYEATVVSEDPVRDLALLKIQTREPLTVMPLGTSSDLMLGETVFAVGNAFGYENTITLGIVSALHRDVEVNDTQSYKNLIQITRPSTRATAAAR